MDFIYGFLFLIALSALISAPEDFFGIVLGIMFLYMAFNFVSCVGHVVKGAL